MEHAFQDDQNEFAPARPSPGTAQGSVAPTTAPPAQDGAESSAGFSASPAFFEEHGISLEVARARPYVKWTPENRDPLREAYEDLPAARSFLLARTREVSGWVITRHAPPWMGLSHVWPAARVRLPARKNCDRLPAQGEVARNYLHDQGFLEPWSRCGQPSRPDLGEFEPGGVAGARGDRAVPRRVC
jgi:hypothetical protein